MRSISYRGLLFSQPTSYWDVNLYAYLPDTSGIYAIQVPNGLQSLEPIYFGETHSFRDSHVRNHHEGIPRWLAHPSAAEGLLISYFEMPDASQAVREYMQSLLIQHYKPACNLAAQGHDRSVSLPELDLLPIEQDQVLRGLRGST
jgi:hypothetical protein